MGRRGRRSGPVGPYRVVDDEEDGAARLTPRGAALTARLVGYEHDSRIRAAALISHTFGLDPVTVLGERIVLNRLLRLAAHNIVQTEQAKASKQSAQ